MVIVITGGDYGGEDVEDKVSVSQISAIANIHDAHVGVPASASEVNQSGN